MTENNNEKVNGKMLVAPLVAIGAFLLLMFGAGYAYFNATTTMATANYQINMPTTTSLVCTKTDCSVNITPAMMTNDNTSSSAAKGTSTCYLNCTCTGTQNAKCNYAVLMGWTASGDTYTPSANLGSGKELTAKATLPTGCSEKNSSKTETQLNSSSWAIAQCNLTVPAAGTVSANVSVVYKWYNLDLDQTAHAGKHYMFILASQSASVG